MTPTNQELWAVEHCGLGGLLDRLAALGYGKLSASHREIVRLGTLDGGGELAIVAVLGSGKIVPGGRACQLAADNLDAVVCWRWAVTP